MPFRQVSHPLFMSPFQQQISYLTLHDPISPENISYCHCVLGTQKHSTALGLQPTEPLVCQSLVCVFRVFKKHSLMPECLSTCVIGWTAKLQFTIYSCRHLNMTQSLVKPEDQRIFIERKWELSGIKESWVLSIAEPLSLKPQYWEICL